MECKISSNSTSWSCRISLRYDYDSDTGDALVTSRVQAFGPDSISDKSSVELWLRRAQVAILSPHYDPSHFSNMNHKQLQEFTKENKASMKSFEKNKICIDIQDPEATDLAFVDLPGSQRTLQNYSDPLTNLSGLIQNESHEIIDLVKTLVEENIRDENTIILVTIPISDSCSFSIDLSCAHILQMTWRINSRCSSQNKLILTGRER